MARLSFVAAAGILLTLAPDDAAAFGRRRCPAVTCPAVTCCEQAAAGSPAAYRPLDAPACTGPVQQGTDQFAGHTGLFFPAPILPAGQFHHFTVIKDPGRAAFNFTSEAVDLVGCITPPNYPTRPFNQGNVGRIFVFAGSTGAQPACFNPPIHRPIRGCPTATGWLFEIDSGGTGNYDMQVVFTPGP
jgi:hypothetical protein